MVFPMLFLLHLFREKTAVDGDTVVEKGEGGLEVVHLWRIFPRTREPKPSFTSPPLFQEKCTKTIGRENSVERRKSWITRPDYYYRDTH